jgi:hypothetical protein
MKKIVKKNEKGKVREDKKTESRFSMRRMEVEGEKHLKRVFDLFGKYIPEERKETFERDAAKAGELFTRWSRAMEEHAKDLLEKFDIPTRQDLERVQRKVESVSFHLIKNLDVQVKKNAGQAGHRQQGRC